MRPCGPVRDRFTWQPPTALPEPLSMTRDDALRQLHHDLRGFLSAVQMDLQTLEALEAAHRPAAAEERLAIVTRAKRALAEAVEVTDRLRSMSRTPPG
jgi:hypothetical protein